MFSCIGNAVALSSILLCPFPTVAPCVFPADNDYLCSVSNANFTWASVVQHNTSTPREGAKPSETYFSALGRYYNIHFHLSNPW